MGDWIAGFIVGIGGSLHCAGMCGPLALALPTGSGGHWRFIIGRLLYNLGRTVTYGVIGLFAGVAGRGLVLAGAQQVVTIVLGLILLFSVVVPALSRKLLPTLTLPARFTGLVSTLVSRLLRSSSGMAFLLVGMLNGLLPCGFVYVGLAAAVTLGDVVRAVLFMVGFGFGTIPVMFAVSVLRGGVQRELQRRLLRVMPVAAVVLALLLIVRGLNLGIPYISPHVSAAETMQPHCH
jgi:uncharacterized protein